MVTETDEDDFTQIKKPIIKAADLTLDYFRQHKSEPGIQLPYPILDHVLRGLRKRELTMVTAMSGAGKSTFCKNIAYYMAKEKNQRVVQIALEEAQYQGFYWFLGLYLQRNPFELEENPDSLKESDLEGFIADFGDKLYVDDHYGSLAANRLIDVLDYYASIECVDFIFLDHISIAVSGQESSREGERKDIDRLVTKLRELIQKTGVGVVCVSHLRNPPTDQQQWEEGRPIRRNDLRGSGALAQISDNRTLKVIKSRRGREQEQYCDTLKYNKATGHMYAHKKANDEEPI
jgi:twinkle protein